MLLSAQTFGGLAFLSFIFFCKSFCKLFRQFGKDMNEPGGERCQTTEEKMKKIN